MEQSNAPLDVLAVIDEMIVQLRDHPGHELAIAIGTRGKVLVDLGRMDEAIATFAKAIEVTLPLSEQDPGAFEVMMGQFVTDYKDACARAQVPPDGVLLAAAAPYIPVD